VADCLTYEEAHKAFRYDPETGKLFRQAGKFAGKEASSWCARGYGHVWHGKHYFTHRIIWLMHYGEFPVGEVDHIDLDKGNNRIENLRQATKSQNQANVPGRIRGRLKGASQLNGKWRAKIKVRGRYLFLGYYATEQEAHEAYKRAAIKHFGEFARAA